MRQLAFVVFAAVSMGLVGCRDGEGIPDGAVELDGSVPGDTDAGLDAGHVETDAGEPDAGEADAGEADAGEMDAGESDAGLDAGLEDAGTNDPAITATDATLTVIEDGMGSGQLSATTDAGLPLTFALQQAPARGTATVDGMGAFTYAPQANFDGTDTFTFRVGDGSRMSTGTVTITVTPVNDAPVITGQSALSVPEDQALTLQPADLVVSDVDDTTFTVSVKAGTNYTFSGNTLTPAPNFNGTLAVQVTVTDPQGLESAVFATNVTVTPVNDPPVITAQGTVTTAEDTARTVTLSDLVFSDLDDTTGFSVIVEPGQHYTASGATFTPEPNYTGALSVNVRVSDGEDSSAPFALAATVTPVNDAPLITAQAAVTFDEDTSRTLALSDVTFTDIDSTSGFTLAVLPGTNYTVSGTTISPAANFNGTLTVQVTVSDGSATSAPFSLNVTVRPVNDAPVITAQNTVNTAEDTARTLGAADLVVTDVDHTWPTGFTITVGAGANYTRTGLTLTPAQNFTGTLTVPVTVTDPSGASSNTFSLTVSVTPVNDAPLITGQQTLSFAEDTSRTLALTDVTFTDSDSTSGFTLAVAAGANYTVTGTTVTPAADFNGTLTVPVTVSDGTTPSQPFNLTVTVTSVNDAPVIAGQNAVTTAEDTARTLVLGDLQVTDVDHPVPTGFTLTVSAGANYSVAGTVVTPAANFSGTLTVPVRLSDQGGALSHTFNLAVTVTGVNDAPVISGQSAISFAEDSSRTLALADVTFTDVDSTSGFTLSVGSGANYSVSGNTVTPALHFNGTLTVPVTVSDGSATSQPFNLTLTVTPVNDAPVITGQNAISTAEDTARTITLADLQVTDVDHTVPTGFTVSLTAGTNYTVSGATFTPAANFAGTLSVQVRVSDPAGAFSNPFTLTVTVTPVNDPPVAVGDSFTAQGNTRITFAGSVLTNDTDAESPTNTLTVSAFTALSSLGGTVAITSAGVVTYTPPVGQAGVNDSFTYTARDPDGATQQGTVTVSLQGPVIWYVDNRVASGDGRSSSPARALADVVPSSGAGSILFVYAGSGAYAGPVVLKANQQLRGEAAGLTALGLTVAPGSRPTISSTAAGTLVTLANGSEVRHVNLSAPNGIVVGAANTTGGQVANATLNAGTVGFQLQNVTGLLIDVVNATGLADSILRVPDGAFVSNLTVRNGTFSNIGNGVGDRAFDFGSGYLANVGPVQGTVLLQNLTVTATGQDGLFLESAGSSGTLTLDNVSLSAPNNGGFGLLVRVDGAVASPTLNLNLLSSSAITVGPGGDALNLAAEGANPATLNVVLAGGSLDAASGGTADDGLRATADGVNSRLNLRVSGTQVRNFNGRAIAVGASANGALLQAIIENVNVSANGSLAPLASGLVVETLTTSSTAEVRASLRSNTVTVPGSALFARARAGTGSRLDLEATNNGFTTTTAVDTVDLGTTGSAFGCAALSGNVASTPPSPFSAWLLQELSPSTFVLEGTQATASAQLTSNNSGAPIFVGAGVGLTSPTTNACRRPTN